MRLSGRGGPPLRTVGPGELPDAHEHDGAPRVDRQPSDELDGPRRPPHPRLAGAIEQDEGEREVRRAFAGPNRDNDIDIAAETVEDRHQPVDRKATKIGVANAREIGSCDHRQTLRLANAERGGRLGLYGFGAAASVAIQVARHWGVEVYACTRGKKHQELALQLGAVWAGEGTDEPPAKLDAAIPAGFKLPRWVSEAPIGK